MPFMAALAALVAVGLFLVLYKGFDMELASALLAAVLGTGLLALLTAGIVSLATLF